MHKDAVLREIRAAVVIAVIRVDSAADAVNAALALHAGGVRAIEITYTVPGAAEVIRELATNNKENAMLLGAGTILTAAQTNEAIDAGAQFIVSPCVIPAVIEVARRRGVPMLPGAFTPTEIYLGHSLGGDIIKVFPASHFGPRYFRELKGPFPQVPLMPAAGVDAANAGEWLRAGAVALGAGSKLVDPTAVKNRDWTELERRARELTMAVRAARAA